MKVVIEETKKINKELRKYYSLRAIVEKNGRKECKQELHLDYYPSEMEIAKFLFITKADFCSVIENYELVEIEDDK